MNDLISRQDAIDAVSKAWMRGAYYTETMNAIKELPSAEPETCAYWDRESNICALHRSSAQRKGKWVLTADGYHCSQCNHKLQTTGIPMYCPNCGARMAKGDQNE